MKKFIREYWFLVILLIFAAFLAYCTFDNIIEGGKERRLHNTMKSEFLIKNKCQAFPLVKNAGPEQILAFKCDDNQIYIW